ncbi:MAG: tetratricopeptide repeat protein [Alphaproteobacteria bacterium]|nr:tetratricopeptide repeat protein [Alphaproteobacteria bacterium]
MDKVPIANFERPGAARRRSAGPAGAVSFAAALLMAGLVAGGLFVAAPFAAPAAAAPNPAVPNPPPAPATADYGDLFGDYLAGRQAQQVRDFSAAAEWYEAAIRIDPQSPELIERTFLMEVTDGRFDRANALAESVLKGDPGDAVAELVQLIQHLKTANTGAALAIAQALPQDGIHRFVGPLALAWTRAAAGDFAGADAALQQFDKFNGFAPLKYFQLGLLYDYAGQPSKAEANFNKAIEASGQLNWRLTDAMANFEERQGHPDQAQALYQRFMKQNAGSELAESVLSSRPTGTPPPLVASPADGLAEAFFDLASVLNQPETIDLALLYDRFSLWLSPHFALAELLLSDVLSAENKPEQSLSVLSEIPANSPYSWSARLRVAANLETLDRTDEAIAQLRAMANEAPTRIGAEMQLGDLLRDKKRFGEAIEAFDEAIRRSAAAGLPERWSLFYDRGVALERNGQWKRAEDDLLHADQLKPDQAMVLNYLGYSWIDRGENLDRGLKMIEKAVELRPEDGYIVDSLGWAHYRLGDFAGAVQYLEKAVELVPEDPTINDHLGDAYWRAGRLLEARYQWQRALQFGPEQGDVKPIEAKLESGLQGPPAEPPHGG